MPAFGFTLGSAFGVSPDLITPGTAANGKALPTGRDLFLFDGDLCLTNGDLSLVSEKPAIAQEIAIRLVFVRGSWFLDTTAGLPYYDSILVKSPNLAAIRTLFTNEILASAGVKSLLSLTLDLNRKTRELTVAFSVNTDVGQLDDEVVL